MEKVINVYCVIDPATSALKAEDLVKTSSIQRFAWWSTTSHGKSAIAKNNLVAHHSRKEALDEAQQRLAALILREEKISDKVEIKDAKPESQPGAKDAKSVMKIESDKLEVPSSITKSLSDKIEALKKLLDAEMEKEPNQSQFYITAVGALSELLAYLKAGTEADFKRAVLKMYSFANFIYLEVPNDVVKFLHGGGLFPKLKDYYYKEVQKKDESGMKDVKVK